MGVAVLVFAGALIGGALSAPTTKVTSPELLLQPPNSNVAPVTYISRHHAQDELGQVNYGFSHPGQAKNEHRDSSGNVAGAYSYTDADDKVVLVEYTAGENGFQVTSNNLPIAVSDTPEVLAAKLQFVEQYNAAALAAAAAHDEGDKEFHVGDSSSSNTAIPVQVTSSPVRDTPEVIAAKLRFVEAYNTAALAAANAPDDPAVPSEDTEFRSKASTYLNPAKDIQEVIAANLQFVEAYNAAALAAAKKAENPQADSSFKVAIVYGLPVVKDTPEILAAKLKFVEDYNAAAKAAALAPDDKVHEVATNLVFSTTEEPAEEPVTELGVLGEQTLETTLSPRYEEEDPEPTTVFPVQKEKGKETTKKLFQLIPTKVGDFSDEKHEELHSESSVAVESKPATDFSLYKYTYSNSGVNVPQAHSYSVGVTKEPIAPIAKTSVLPTPLFLPSSADQTIVVPVTNINRHHAQDETGQVNYGYSYPGQAQNELRDASGNVEGVYTYVDEENKVIRVEYTAGKDGFKVKSNNLPIAAQDTPEVLAAKLQFVEAYNTAAIAAANAPDDPVESALLDKDSTSVSFIHPNAVKDTQEVVAAKLQFVEAYNAAALAAANAPDDPVELITPQYDTVAQFVDHYPIRDTPDVIAAKLEFVETYNAAALAAGATNERGKDDIPKATLAYALHPVKDTPEVIAAKIQFVEAYNAAALAAALAPDDEMQHRDETGEEAQTYAAAQPVVVTGEYSDDIPAVIPTSLQVPSVDVPVTYVSRHHTQDEHGQVNYGFSHPGQAKNEVRDADGHVAGAYSYVDSDDQVIRVRYTAGEDGFQVVSNNLPIAPLDTPEVIAAKLQFVEAYNAASLAAAAAPDDVKSESSISSGGALVGPSPVKDTPEVLAAKLQFVEAYNAAALAAANAPDYPSDEYPMDGIPVDPNPVRDNPEVTEAKLNFAEAYNAAAIAAIPTGDTPDLTPNTIFAPHPVKDTPEVIAAKIAFVEAYNAAALAAALAPDDDVIYATAEEPSEYEAVTALGERSTEESVTDAVSETNNSQNLVAIDLPEVSQPLDDLVKTSQIVKSVAPRTSVEYQAFPGPFTRYAGYLPGADRTAPTMYTYSIPHGLYGLHPSTSVKGFPFSVHFVPAKLVQQDVGQTKNHVTIYAPSHAY